MFDLIIGLTIWTSIVKTINHTASFYDKEISVSQMAINETQIIDNGECQIIIRREN